LKITKLILILVSFLQLFMLTSYHYLLRNSSQIIQHDPVDL